MSRPPSVGRFVRPSRGHVRPRPRSGARATLAALLPLLLSCGLLALAPPAAAADGRPRPRRPWCPPARGADAVELDTTLYLPDGDDPAPAVVLAHGFGGSKDSVADDAQDLAEPRLRRPHLLRARLRRAAPGRSG